MARQALGGVDSQHSSACSTATGTMNQPPTGQKYVGEEKIVVAIDLGTTQSAVSFAYLYQGENSSVRMVIKWPGQPEASGDSKIPSIVVYKERNLVACGAEALDYVDDPGCDVVKWFKLHLHPEIIKVEDMESMQLEVPLLPKRITLQRVYSDLLAYLFSHTRAFFVNNTPGGEAIWSRLESGISIVLAIPNGWENDQQAFLRDAAISGGLINQDNANYRLKFVTEGEASVHYVLAHSHSGVWLKPGIKFAVMDAGGSTVDSTLYSCKQTDPKLILEEVRASECVQAGGVFIDRAARALLEEKLKGSKFRDMDSINAMIEEFEKKTKRIFDGSQSSNIVHFGRGSDNERTHGILRGKLSLDQDEVAQTFQDALATIIESSLQLVRGHTVKHILLVGGFGESPFLRVRLREAFIGTETDVITVEEPSKKAAAEGAAIWFIKHFVTSRATRFSYGTVFSYTYDSKNPLHKERKHKVFLDTDGTKKIDGFFDSWVSKNTVVDESFAKVESYYRTFKKRPSELGNFSLDIYAWAGDGVATWCLDTQDNLLPGMRILCTLQADLSGLGATLEPKIGSHGRKHWKVLFEVAVHFGGTQIQARLRWKEGGRLCEGPISVLPNSTF